MQDLAQIAQVNAKATEAHIPAALAAGKFVVEQRVGLHFFGHTEHDTLGEALAKSNEINADGSPGMSTRLRHPETAAAI